MTIKAHIPMAGNDTGQPYLEAEITRLRAENERLTAENTRLANTLKLHAGDCASLNNEVELMRSHWDDAEAQLEEMTRSCLTEREGRLAAEAREAKAVGDMKERAAKAIEALPWYVHMSPKHLRARKPEEYASVVRALPTEVQNAD